jgi:hypothetical protein
MLEGSLLVGAVRGRERETVGDRRNSNRTDSATLENIHMSKVGERKESIRLRNSQSIAKH